MKKQAIRTLDRLAEDGLIAPQQISALSETVQTLPLSITPEIYARIDKDNTLDPIAQQFIPSVQELKISPDEQTDPIGDQQFMKVTGLVHRYPDRCLLMPVNICPVYCRFCFRREVIAGANKTLNSQELTAAFEYIENHSEIWEVILTGGDPLILKPMQLHKIITRLSQINHVEIIRIHTRIPVVDPERITTELIQALKSHKTLYVVLHANHPQEFSLPALEACEALINAGFPMLSQTTLLKNVNDNIEVLSTLMRLFVKHRIKPYYLHHADLARGTQHFRTDILTGQKLVKELRGRFSGLCQPTYVLDIPNGKGKVPIGPNYLNSLDEKENRYSVEDYLGHKHEYKSP